MAGDGGHAVDGGHATPFPESVLDGTDLLDVWPGERRNPDDFWLT